LQSWKGARFIGLYACFPIEKNVRQAEILGQLLQLEGSLDFSTIKTGLLQKGVREGQFTTQRLSEALKALQAGNADWLQLHSAPLDKDWVRVYEDYIEVAWHSSITEFTRRPPSPIDKRFGDAGSVVITYPLSRFRVDLESSFQVRLVQLMKNLTQEHGLYWSFIHEGFRPKRPASLGEDDVFQDTREKFPLTSFDSDLHIARFFKEFVKGAFWANFLNPIHVERLGGYRE